MKQRKKTKERQKNRRKGMGEEIVKNEDTHTKKKENNNGKNVKKNYLKLEKKYC